MLVEEEINLLSNLIREFTLMISVVPLKMLQKPDFSPNFP